MPLLLGSLRFKKKIFGIVGDWLCSNTLGRHHSIQLSLTLTEALFPEPLCLMVAVTTAVQTLKHVTHSFSVFISLPMSVSQSVSILVLSCSAVVFYEMRLGSLCISTLKYWHASQNNFAFFSRCCLQNSGFSKALGDLRDFKFSREKQVMML